MEQIKEALTENPELSNRGIAATLGVNDKTVGKIRQELEAQGAIPVVTHIIGQDGKRRPRNGNYQQPAVQEVKQSGAVVSFPSLERYTPKKRLRTNSSVVGQVQTAMASHPLAFLIALPFGGFVPLAVWTLTHLETPEWYQWIMIGGGALFSSLTVIQWGEEVLESLPKAIGFAILLEGVMITSRTDWLSYTALGLLIVINAVACSVALSSRR